MSLLLLNEAYRPKTFDDVIGLDSTVSELVKTNMPHFLFVGDAGTGKTTTAKIIIKKLDAECLTLNASEERGIDVIRDKVKTYAMTRSANGKPKIVFLDEADAITKDGQNSLRNMMEEYSRNCKFILTGNYENKIIDPIKSRCTKIIFRRPTIEQLTGRLDYICAEENIIYELKDCVKIAEMSGGDYRRAINLLQRFSINNKLVIMETENNDVTEVLELLKQRKFIPARQYVLDNINDHEGFLTRLFREVVEGEYSVTVKKTVIEQISEAMFRMNFVADKEIQTSTVLLKIMESLNA